MYPCMQCYQVDSSAFDLRETGARAFEMLVREVFKYCFLRINHFLLCLCVMFSVGFSDQGEK